MARSTLSRRSLTIQQVFLLLAFLNGIVLATLVNSAWRLLKDPGSGVDHAYTTFFLAGLLVVGVGISSLIVSQRVVAPLRGLVRESHAISTDESIHQEQLAVRGTDEIARLADAFNGVLRRQRQAIDQLDSANQRLREVNK
ncbi:MAG: HAMP domain-containing protein, partial [Vulcanococcus sp.]